ncbi:MAPEG family protein [Enhygromyxa salina]|uniref:Microsomal glutathione S-transferase 1 n=1 Tax=Enhygromyxa salina TaxID=215803 RepID=A0A2S9YN94_9BACT|nr:MAPEG family protein [Enhygromyxa salina]PRQ06552.1 MAPEG family protein [Enhygromyxa salina]
MDNDAFNIYLLCVAALAFNVWFLVTLIAVRRGKAKAFVNAEDAKAFKGNIAEADAPSVERAKAAHRNALENIPLFAILGLLYLTTGGTKSGALAYFVTFAVSRWLHTFSYLAGMQPWRTLAFTIGLLVNVGLSVQLVIAAMA